VNLRLAASDNGERVTSQALYNLKQKHRKENLEGYTSSQKLLQELNEEDWVYHYSLDEDNKLQALLFAPKSSITMCRLYNKSIIMDCKYQTNKYNLKLLDVVGVTCLNSTFYVCFIYIPKEDETWFFWALSSLKEFYGDVEPPKSISMDRDLALINAAKAVFPTSNIIICTWHITGNVAKNLKGKVENFVQWGEFMQDWNSVMFAVTESIFEEKWNLLCTKYESLPEIINYLSQTWISLKENFVSCYINRFFHLGQSTTQRVEGAHSVVKGYVVNSSGDLLTVKKGIELLVDKQRRKYEFDIAHQKSRQLHCTNNNFFSRVNKTVSQFALKVMNKQYQKAMITGPLDECNEYYIKVMGLPCSRY
jgi:hypothetical protein